jgi:hypothetical protein
MNRRATAYVFFVCILGLCLAISLPLRAQVAGATLSGNITDPQRAAIPNAKVSAKNLATGVRTDTNTNSAGAYTAEAFGGHRHLVVSREEVGHGRGGHAAMPMNTVDPVVLATRPLRSTAR